MDYDVLMFAIYTLNIAGYGVMFNTNESDARITIKKNNTVYEFDSIKELIDFTWAI